MEELKPASLLDIGCGTGQSLDYFIARGVDARGIEGSTLAISKAGNQERITEWNLEKEYKLDRKFDVTYSFEVVEHVSEKHIVPLMRTLTNHSDWVVMTAAHPGQGGAGHFNEQPAGYWIEKFDKHGFELVEDMTRAVKATGETHADNALVFRRR